MRCLRASGRDDNARQARPSLYAVVAVVIDREGCKNYPTEQTIRTELDLIQRSGATEAVQADLLAMALRVGARSFSRSVLEAIFREALPMVQGASIIDDWIAEGEARGEARGKAEEARKLLLTLLRARFDEIPHALVAAVESADAGWCEEFLARAARAESLRELGW